MMIDSQEEPLGSRIKKTVSVDGVIVGRASAYIIHNDRHDEPYAVLEDLFVREEHRGNGYGKALMEALLADIKAKGCYKVLAQSRYSRPRVHQMYLRYGFRDYGKNFRMDLRESPPKLGF